METLYQTLGVIKRLREYFEPYLCLLSKPSGHKMFLLLLALLAMQFSTSIRHVYKWFLSGMDKISLNSYYYLLSYTEIPLSKFFKITVKLAVSLIPEVLASLPIFLIIDDTLQAKFGTKFECYQTIFDHTKRNGTNYLKGHCFVALSIRIPVTVGGTLTYLNIPVGYLLRSVGQNKLEIAGRLIDSAMEVLKDHPMVILLCDSWYPKGKVLQTVKKYENLELIANVRADTSIFDLPPVRTGKPGRPKLKGRKLDIHTDLDFIRVGDYFIAVKVVLTNLFGQLPVYLTVTTPDLLNAGAYRVFICTVMPDDLNTQFGEHRKTLSDSLNSQILWLLPLYLYSFRWAIEVMFYEQKTFWSLGLYRLRNKNGIENFVNFSALCYACMKILPHTDNTFSCLRNESPQTCKYLLGEAVRLDLFFHRFASDTQNSFIPYSPFDVLVQHSFHPFRHSA